MDFSRLKLFQGSSRMIISTDTDSNWLPMFRNLSTPFHQILLVPVYQDGGTCGQYLRERTKVVPPSDLSFAGVTSRGLESNIDINCPSTKDERN